MILPSDKTDEKKTLPTRVSLERDHLSQRTLTGFWGGCQEEPPPSYADSETALAPDTQTSARPQPCNFVSIIRKHSSVKGSFVIDPSIYIPDAHLPPLQGDEKEEGRRNLRLKSHHGSVDAEILLVDDSSGEGSKVGVKRTTVDLGSHHGSVLAKVVRGSASFGLV
jgi:hypothetical protein